MGFKNGSWVSFTTFDHGVDGMIVGVWDGLGLPTQYCVQWIDDNFRVCSADFLAEQLELIADG